VTRPDEEIHPHSLFSSTYLRKPIWYEFVEVLVSGSQDLSELILVGPGNGSQVSAGEMSNEASLLRNSGY